MDDADADAGERLRAAFRACTETTFWHPPTTPAEVFAALGEACGELGIDRWDMYGNGGAVTQLETEVAATLGKPAAVFFPSGVMAQQSTLRVWCERSGSRRVAIPDRSHLLVHEEDGPRLLHGFRFEHLTTGRRTATAGDLRGLATGLGAAMVELPLRDAGCAVPGWEELAELSAAARELGVPLHADGARIWEAQPFLEHSLEEVAGLFDSVYVSFYKGLAGLAGAAVVGPEDVMAEVRRWRTRMGGTLFRMTPYAVAALVGLRDHLPRMADNLAWARAVAAELVEAGLPVTPDPPHTNTFLVFARGVPDEINERLAGFMERERTQLTGPWWEADVPGYAVTEVVVGPAAQAHDPAKVARWVAEVAGG